MQNRSISVTKIGEFIDIFLPAIFDMKRRTSIIRQDFVVADNLIDVAKFDEKHILEKSFVYPGRVVGEELIGWPFAESTS